MKNILYILLFFILPITSFAQKQANIWYFGNFAGLDFNSGAPVPLFDGQLITNEGCASIADKNTGQLLFYTDGTSVWDKTHSIMPANQSTQLLGNPSSTQSAVIVPMPGSNTKYYIFTADAQAGNSLSSTSLFGGVAYNIVDMTLNGGLGDITTINKPLLTPTCEKISAVRHCNGHDIWLAIHQWNSDAFYTYLVTNTGIGAPVISHTGIIHQNIGSSGDAETIGYMKFSPDGKRLAVACYIDLNTVQIFDFDNATGKVSNPITDNNYPLGFGYDGPYGLTFSPNSSLLYATQYGVLDSSIVYQYNLLAGSPAAVVASRTTVAGNLFYPLAAMQIGPDGKIYVAKAGGDSLDVIDNPNALGAACNYTVNEVYLGGTGTCNDGLPDMVESFLIPPVQATASYQPGCSGSGSLTFIDTTLNGKITFLWNFGDPNSGKSDTSSLQNPTHSFSNSGSYTVTLYFRNACHTDTFKKVVVISAGAFTVDAGPDVTICTGGSYPINLTGVPTGGTIVWNPATGLSCTNCATPSASPATTTTYTVVVTNATGCSFSDNITISITSKVVASVTPHTNTICGSGSVQLQASGGNVYLWSPGTGLDNATISNPLASPTVTTTYSVTVSIATGNCGVSTDSAVITVSPVPTVQASNDTTICSGDTAFLRSGGTGISSYQWTPPTGLNCTTCPNPHASPTATTTYTVTVNGNMQCSSSGMITVTLNGSLNATAVPDTTICTGDAIQLQVSGGNNYLWTPAAGLNDSTISDPIANPSATTTYTITVLGGICPNKTVYDTITVVSLPGVDAGSDVTIISGTATQLTATGSGKEYEWAPGYNISNPGIANPVVHPLTTTTYTVTTTDENGCTASDNVVISVRAAAFIMLPNAFSPNSDGTNDVLFPKYYKIATMDLKIFNRWGQLIFHSTNLDIGWDGKFNGKDEPMGSYAYEITAVSEFGENINVKGDVTIIR